MADFNIFEHQLVPSHRVLSETEKNKLLEKLKIKSWQLPRISIKDAAIKQLKEGLKEGEEDKIKIGDIVEIIRDSETAGKSTYYRVIVNE